MANESIVAIPPNVDEPIVLRRVLSSIIENLDVTIGTRGTNAQTYVSQADLIAVNTQLVKQLDVLTAQQDATAASLTKLYNILQDALII